jgi:hypothetical protein
MKQIPEELLSEVLKIIGDAVQKTIQNAHVFAIAQELLKIQNAPNPVEKK